MRRAAIATAAVAGAAAVVGAVFFGLSASASSRASSTDDPDEFFRSRDASSHHYWTAVGLLSAAGVAGLVSVVLFLRETRPAPERGVRVSGGAWPVAGGALGSVRVRY